MMRLFLILMLAWQPLSFQSVGAPALASPMHVASSCCEVIVADACCEPVVVSRCGMTGGSCHCDAEPGLPVRQHIPAISTVTPPVRSLVPAPFEGVLVIDTPRSAPATRAGVQGRSACTHNTFQASLGVWRT